MGKMLLYLGKIKFLKVIMFTELFEKIKRNDTIIIHRHLNPDGDALGSQIGLKNILLDNFPNKAVYVVGDNGGRYSFIDGSKMDDIPDSMYKNALAIVLDTSAKSLISDLRYETAKETARIDHHLFVEKLCETEVVDSTFESCAGLVAYFAYSLKLKLSPASAKALYTGMVTDSGRFRYDGVTSKTFLMASFLFEQEFSPADIYTNLYADDLDMIRLRAKFTLKAQLTPEKVGYIYTDYAEFLTYGVSAFTISRGMVNTMAEIKGVDVWVNFTETENSVLAELRSTKYNVNQIAVKYGGGGHLKASGATLKNREEAMCMLNDLNQLVLKGETL